jgi:hypothetical protein
MVAAFETGRPDGRGYCEVAALVACRPGMKFFVIFISVKLAARLDAIAALISIASHFTLHTSHFPLTTGY